MLQDLNLPETTNWITRKGLIQCLRNKEDAGVIRNGGIPQYILDIISIIKQINKMVNAMSKFLINLYKTFWMYIWIPRCKSFIKQEGELGITKEMKYRSERSL